MHLEKGFRQEARNPIIQQYRGNPTPVFSCITCREVPQGHCEGEVSRLVHDGHSAPPHLSLGGAGLHYLREEGQARLSAPILDKGLVLLPVPALHAQGPAHGAGHRVRAAQRQRACKTQSGLSSPRRTCARGTFGVRSSGSHPEAGGRKGQEPARTGMLLNKQPAVPRTAFTHRMIQPQCEEPSGAHSAEPGNSPDRSGCVSAAGT